MTKIRCGKCRTEFWVDESETFVVCSCGAKNRIPREVRKQTSVNKSARINCKIGDPNYWDEYHKLMSDLVTQINLGIYTWPSVRNVQAVGPGEFIIITADEFFDGRATPETDGERNLVSFLQYLMSNPSNPNFDAGIYLFKCATRDYGSVPVLELMARRHTDKPGSPKKTVALFPIIESNDNQENSAMLQGYDSAKKIIDLQRKIVLTGGDNFRTVLEAAVWG